MPSFTHSKNMIWAQTLKKRITWHRPSQLGGTICHLNDNTLHILPELFYVKFDDCSFKRLRRYDFGLQNLQGAQLSYCWTPVNCCREVRKITFKQATYVNDLEYHSRSSELPLFDWLHITSYERSIVTKTLSGTISEILPH